MEHTVQSQDAVFRFLTETATHGGRPVRRIDTHAAAVFLMGERALKVKRAVRFPFLDYSTLDKRKAACEAEIEVNKPFAPEIYLRVIPVTRAADGRLVLGGTGEPVEWALEMRRFDEERTLDRLAEAGEIDAALADALGRVVATAHRVAPVVEAEPWIEALHKFLAQNAEAFRENPDIFPPADVDSLTTANRAALDRIAPLIRARGKLGLVRRGHGDLHLGNIAMIAGKPVLFDAIEFDPLIAAGDVFYDLAFLLMDLIERGLPAPANMVFNRYLAETRREQDLDALAALPFYLSLRAAIRAKVTAARLEQAKGEARAKITTSAQTYFALARRLITPPAPTLIAIGGLSGCGKSLIARMLAPDIAPAPGAVVLRSDVERKALFGVGETEKLPPAAYELDVTQKVYAALADKARRVIAAGHGAIVDAVCAQADERDAIAAVAASAGVRFAGLFLTADLATRVARVGARDKDASDADAAVVRQQEGYDIGPLAWARVDASGTPEETLKRAKKALEPK